MTHFNKKLKNSTTDADRIKKIKQSKARVMIMTPTYNRADLIEETIQSVLNQDYEDFIYVILDDGSTDNTKEVVNRAISGKKNCFYLFHENIGEAETVNRGWSLCNTEYFVQVNSDDTIEKNLLSEMVSALDDHPECVVAYPDFYIIDEKGNMREKTKNSDWNFLDALSDFSCYAAAPGAFMRKSKLSDIKILKDSRFKHTNDIKMLWNIALRGNFIHIPKFLASWRSHEQGISSNRYQAIDEINVWINEYFSQELPKSVRDIEKECRRSIYKYYAQLMKASDRDYGNDMHNYYTQKADLPMPKYVNLQIGDNDLIGNKFNGHDLHINLRKMNIDSQHLVWNKESADKNTYVIAGEKSDRQEIRAYGEYVQDIYSLDNLQNPIIYDIIYNKLFLDTDIVHLHLMHNGLWDLNLLPLMTKLKPIVWTIHDMWIVTGSDLAKTRPDYYFPIKASHNESLNWELKKWAIKKSDITFVVASKYMEKALREHEEFKHKRIEYIPFGIDADVLYPRNNAETRKELGFDAAEKLILVRGSGGERKGAHFIEHVMKTVGLDDNVHFLVVGGEDLNIPAGVKFTSYGWIKDDELMAKLYSISDLFLMPSTREYFGMMAIEAMACGTLPLVIDGTSLPEAVNSPSCGVSTASNYDEYERAVRLYLKNSKDKKDREKRCLEYVRKKHSMTKYLDTIDRLYQDVIKNHAGQKLDLKLRDDIYRSAVIMPRVKPIQNQDSDRINPIFMELAAEPISKELNRIRSELAMVYGRKIWRLISGFDKTRRYGKKIVQSIRYNGLKKTMSLAKKRLFKNKDLQ